MTEVQPKSIEPEQFKYLLDRKTSKPQHHVKYDYYKPDTIEKELNEFISYAEVKHDLILYQQDYNKHFSAWNDCTTRERKDIIQQTCNSLDLTTEKERLSFARCLVYISLGCFNENQKLQYIMNMKENNELLFQADVLSTLKQSLNHACHQIETLSMNCQTELVETHCKEIDIYLTILYLVIEFNKENQLEDYYLAEFLFDLVVRLKEHFTKIFPLKKLMMNLHKALLLTLGDLNNKEEYNELKSSIRVACELPIVNGDKSKTVKCNPEELYNFYQQSCNRYPTFSPPKNLIEKKISNSLFITASNQLSKSMGLLNASKNIDLPYQTLFPSKNQQTQQSVNNTSNNKKSLIETTHILPFSDKSSITPFSLNEANDIWLNHLYISIADYQIIYEREVAVNRWQRWNENNEKYTDDWKNIIYNKLSATEQKKMNTIEHLYSSISPHFQSIVVVILKLLLSTVSLNKDKEAEIVEDINITRKRETVSKSVSYIVLLLLKWFKISHVLKFEYLSQILVDSGCMLLILKLLGLQEVALLASKKTDDYSQSFFGFIERDNRPNGLIEEEEDEELYTNERNLCWSINLLKILQMLTKKKTHRIILLVQYKSSAILKRLLKVGHPIVDLYVLKNLKNQVPFMGRKWRSSNMKTISAIYSNILTTLNDDWLSCVEGSTDVEDGTLKEINLRMLTRLYNGHRYLPNILPKMDETTGRDSTLFYLNNIEERKTQLPEYNLNSPVLVDDVELDIDFKKDYNTWLESNVYSTTDDEEEEEDEEEDEDEEEELNNSNINWHIGTPLPDNLLVPITAEELTKEINKLYLEELEREFIQKQQKQLELESETVTDSWDQPAFSSDNWSSNDNKHKKKLLLLDDEDADEIEPEIDPLKGINWDNLTEEELKKRLTLVEEKTVKRWMNVDMDDPRYMKVLNTFEGDIPEDDEGWPI